MIYGIYEAGQLKKIYLDDEPVYKLFGVKFGQLGEAQKKARGQGIDLIIANSRGQLYDLENERKVIPIDANTIELEYCGVDEDVPDNYVKITREENKATFEYWEERIRAVQELVVYRAEVHCYLRPVNKYPATAEEYRRIGGEINRIREEIERNINSLNLSSDLVEVVGYGVHKDTTSTSYYDPDLMVGALEAACDDIKDD